MDAVAVRGSGKKPRSASIQTVSHGRPDRSATLRSFDLSAHWIGTDARPTALKA
jgi:hypothetical protein